VIVTGAAILYAAYVDGHTIQFVGRYATAAAITGAILVFCALLGGTGELIEWWRWNRVESEDEEAKIQRDSLHYLMQLAESTRRATSHNTRAIQSHSEALRAMLRILENRPVVVRDHCCYAAGLSDGLAHDPSCTSFESVEVSSAEGVANDGEP